MNNFWIYTKSLAVSLVAMFAICIAVIGIVGASKLFIVIVGGALGICAFGALGLTVYALFCDWRNRRAPH